MTPRLPARTIVVETCTGAAANAAAATLPTLLTASAAAPQSLHAAAASLAPQMMAGAVMSVVVPSLLTAWRQSRGRCAGRPAAARALLLRTATTALMLAVPFTGLALALVLLLLPAVIGDSVDRTTTAVIGGIEGALAAAVLTPLALVALHGSGR